MPIKTLEPNLLQRVEAWLKGPFDEATKREIQRLMESDPQGLSDAFFKDLSFGTGGMRGLMGVGPNRMNVYTIRAATQGLANYLNKQPKPEEGRHTVFIGYDVRHHSKEFASEAARVLAANEIRVLLTSDICPTPLVSYGCRHYGCSAAIMITASHNPPAYNGYKVYWGDGGQVVPPHDIGIIEEVRQVATHAPISLAPADSPLIETIEQEIDEDYLTELVKLQLHPEIASDELNLLYTPLHGTGIRIIPQALASWGYHHLHLIEEQKDPDPNFSNAPSPNPEEQKALEIGMAILRKTNADLLIATDPDADRMGLVALDKGHPFRFTGNQIACLSLFHICNTLATRGILPSNAAFIKTIVTTELFRAIAESFGGLCIDVLTGFKYIGEQITLWEKSFDANQFIYGAEESYGYLFGTMVRDKDAINAACLIAEAAMLAKKQGLTLVDRLYQLYEKFGIYREAVANLAFAESAAGLANMQELMKQLRQNPPASIGGQLIVAFEDYQTGLSRDLQHHTEKRLSLPSSDVLCFWFADWSKLVIRPSGTEPKIKIYAEVIEKHADPIEHAIHRADGKLQHLLTSFQGLLK
ncbi:MAG: phospho-sugar mutase [Verrucomicrobiota bacterium]|nr:phospho-sugar mutase [Verrucomicrobiota bacterium]